MKKGIKQAHAWETDFAKKSGAFVWAKNSISHVRSAREWHWVSAAHLRKMGIKTPEYKVAWEVDWTKRSHHQRPSGPEVRVWARNVSSPAPSAREWHWVSVKALSNAGVSWERQKPIKGFNVSPNGYVRLNRHGVTKEQRLFADKNGLWNSKGNIAEHIIVAAMKYGSIPAGFVVRHINGIKTDNRPENLIIGTHKENQMDHITARLEAMMWREKYEKLLASIQKSQ